MIDPIKAAIGALFIALLAFASYQIYEAGYARSEAKHEALKAEAEAANKKLITELGERHAKDQAETDRLRANNRALWLRLQPAPCGGNPATGSDDSAGGKSLPGIEQTSNPTSAEEALREYTDRVADLMHEADTMRNNCAVVMDWAKGKK